MRVRSACSVRRFPDRRAELFCALTLYEDC
jgi:hypothetical protein